MMRYNMSKELQDKADKVIKELKEAVIPIREEIRRIKESSGRLI
jgi:hypothetical protein